MTTQGITPVPNLFLTRKALQDTSTWGVNVDAAVNALVREGGKFMPMTWPGAFGNATLAALVGPGHFYNGSVLTEIGSRTTGNFTNANSNVSNVANTTGITVGMMVMAFTFTAVSFTGNTTNGSATIASPSSTAGLFVGMPIYGPGIAPGATITAIGASITMSANATATATGVTISSSGFTPIVSYNTIVTAVTSSSITLSQNATATVTGAFLFVLQPVGTRTTGNTTNGSANVTNLPSVQGIFVGMPITGTGIPSNTTVAGILTSTSIQLSANASATNTGTVLTITIPVPSANSRIDYITINQLTGLVNWVQGTQAASPSPPALPAGQLPCALILQTSAQTTIGTADISDVRDLSSMGMQNGAFTQVNLVSPIILAIRQGINLG